MHFFIDPRTSPEPAPGRTPARTTTGPGELAELHRLCREGRLYDVERWIREDRPLQVSDRGPGGRRRVSSALEIALEREDHALVLLLLCNGYDTGAELDSPLDFALQARRVDLLDLLLEWGADPHRVDLNDLFATYSTNLFRRFREMGVDLTKGHALAWALAHHTSNKPLFGFAKRSRHGEPEVQSELNMALGYHAAHGNEKGVSLCIWAGADPHASTLNLGYEASCEENDNDGGEGPRFRGFSAIWYACRCGDARILEQLGPDPARDDFDDLYEAAGNGAVIDLLARSVLPKDVGAVIDRHLWSLTLPFDEWRSIGTLRRLFAVGARWKDSSTEAIAGIRHFMLRISDQSFVDAMKLFAAGDHCSPEILKELARTPAMRARMSVVGFIPTPPGQRVNRNVPRPTRSREVLSKFGIEIPKPKKRPDPSPGP